MIGRTISHYDVLETLGEGGMGVVYKARDTQLNRFVALKALSGSVAADPERRSRFLQEAQAASALNHPNIVTIHDVLRHEDGDFIVMELVAGKTLDRLIPRKGMPIGEALRIAVQVASALEAAHEAGIVHRDLKPGNVIVADDGRVRVLDFGLAKLSAAAPDAGEEETRTRATEAAPQTRDGQILGTASYMSPEQAEGRPVDARTDVFSFGAVLYEMLSGQRPFQGRSTVSTLAAVIKEDPAPLPADVPHDLAKLVERCLRKDPQRRIRHMSEVRLALEDLREESDSGTLALTAPAAPTPRRRRRLWFTALGAAAMVTAVASAAWLWRARTPARPRTPPREVPFTTEPGSEAGGRFSPDGSTVAFSRGDYETQTLEVKVLGAAGSQALGQKGFLPAFSPDGRWVAFYLPEGGAYRKAAILLIPRTGGEERLVAEVRGPDYPERSVSWTPDGEWLACPDRDADGGPFHVSLISARSGEKRRLTSPPPDIYGDTGAAVSPDGRNLVFTRRVEWGVSDLYLLPIGEDHVPTGEPRLLTRDVPNANGAVWTPDGKEIVFTSRVFHAATLWRAAADGSTPPQPLGLGGRGAYFPDVDATGSRLLYTKHVWDLNVWRVALLPSGLAASPPAPFLRSNMVDDAAAFSPDGAWVAFVSERSGTRELWLADAQGGRLRQLTTLDSAWGMSPVWDPRGEWIAFEASVAGRRRDLYVVSSRGGSARQLTSDPADDASPRWEPDGRHLVFDSDRGGLRRRWTVPIEGGDAVPALDQRAGGDDSAGAYRYFAEETKDGWSIKRQRRDGPTESLVQGASNSAFAVTSRGLYFTEPGPAPSFVPNVSFFDFASRKTARVAELPRGTGSGRSLSVSPDGRTLLYTQCDEESDDLVLVENFR
jgi:Tol biopolymer transport system component/predicted Ser/Thr protein kinase